MLLIGPGIVLSAEGLFEDWGVLCDGGTIHSVGAYPELEKAHPDAEKLDADYGLILPGLINAHTRLFATFARGISPGTPPPGDSHERNERTLWRLDRALTAEDVDAAVTLGLIECAKSGVTTVIDHHSSPGAVANSPDVIANAVDRVGLRASLCHEVSDRNGEDKAREAMAENLRFYFASQSLAEGSHARGHFGLHASYTIGDTTSDRLQTINFVAGPNTSLHLHLAEGPRDGADARNRGASGVVDRLRRAGMLDERTIAAHAVNLTNDELNVLAELGVSVVHLPRSNMTAGVGRARVDEMLQRDMTVGLGTDGIDANMIAEMRTAALLLRHDRKSADAGTLEARRMVFEGNPIIAARLLPEAPGAISPGSPADIVCFDYDPITPVGAGNFITHLFEGVSASDVRHTVCAGSVVMRDRTVLGVDEAAVRDRAADLAAAAWERMPEADASTPAASGSSDGASNWSDDALPPVTAAPLPDSDGW